MYMSNIQSPMIHWCQGQATYFSALSALLSLSRLNGRASYFPDVPQDQVKTLAVSLQSKVQYLFVSACGCSCHWQNLRANKSITSVPSPFPSREMMRKMPTQPSPQIESQIKNIPVLVRMVNHVRITNSDSPCALCALCFFFAKGFIGKEIRIHTIFMCII